MEMMETDDGNDGSDGWLFAESEMIAVTFCRQQQDNCSKI